jgi:DHA3 family macrolide efflux protein-like MFS transporter
MASKLEARKAKKDFMNNSGGKSDKLWRLPFLLIWSGQALSLAGSSVVHFALIWWLTKLTGSAKTLAIASLVGLLPEIFISPFTGALMDRMSRRWAMMTADGLIAFFTALLSLLFWLDIARTWHIYMVLFFRSLASAVHSPAMVASTSMMVPDKHLTRVAGMNQSLSGTIRIASPPLGAVLLSTLPMQGIISIDVVTAMIAIVPLLFIAIPQPLRNEPPVQRNVKLVFQDILEGFHYIWRRRELLLLITTASLVDFVTIPAISFLPLLVTQHFARGAMGLGLLHSIQGGGIIAGGLIISAWGGLKNRLRTCLLGWALTGVSSLVFGLTAAQAFWLGMASMALLGLSLPIGSAPLTALLQSTVAKEMQGRFFSMYGSLYSIMLLLGLAAGGLLGDAIGVRIWWILSGVGHILLAFFWHISRAGYQFEERVGP